MSIQDADCLGRCLEAHLEDPVAALHQYQAERIPQTTQEVRTSVTGHTDGKYFAMSTSATLTCTASLHEPAD